LKGAPLPTASLPGNQPTVAPENHVPWDSHRTTAAGGYAGVLTNSGGEGIGFLSLVAKNTGALSGSVLFDGLRLTFRGTLNPDGSFTTPLVFARTGRNFTLTLQLVSTPEGFRLTGTFAEGAIDYGASLDHAAFKARTNPAPWAGAYTALLPANPLHPDGTTHPQGDGWATVTVAADGKVRLAGRLGDNTKLTLTGVTSKDATLRLFASLYKSVPKGTLAGTITFRDVPNVSDFDGSLSWRKPANSNDKLYPGGFAMEVRLVGSIFARPFTGDLILTQLAEQPANATWILDEGDLPANPGQKIVTWGTAQITYTPTATEKLSFRASATNGAVSGSYVDRAAGLNVKFAGVAFQKQGLVSGVFAGINQTGYLLMRPTGGPTLEVRSFAGDVRLQNEDNTPDPADGTDLGEAGVEGGYAERSFRLRNTGTGNLFILAPPTVTGSGFTLVACRTGAILPGEETLLTVRFDPVSPGAAGASVTIESNDVDYHPFTFDLAATGIPGAAVNDDGAD
jgi:hypothetical protein